MLDLSAAFSATAIQRGLLRIRFKGAISKPRALKALKKHNVEYAHNRGWLDIDQGEGPSDSGYSTEKRHQEKCLRARVEETARHRQGFAMTGKECLLVDAEARAKLLREGGLSDLDPSP